MASQSAPSHHQRIESGYASASLANSADSNTLPQSSAGRPVLQRTGRLPVPSSGAHLLPMGSTSSEEDEPYVSKWSSQRKDSLDVARSHGTGTKHKRKSKTGKTPPAKASAISGPGNELEEETPESYAANGIDHPSIVPVSPTASQATSPIKPSQAREQVASPENGVTSQESPKHVLTQQTSWDKMIAEEAQSRTHARDPQKFAASMRRLESKNGSRTSHRVLDHLLNYEHPTDDSRDPNPVLAHALLNSVVGEDTANSRDATGVFETTSAQAPSGMPMIVEDRVITKPSAEAKQAESKQGAQSSAQEDSSARLLTTDEAEAAERTLQHKESLLMEKSYSLSQAKREARESLARHRQETSVSSQTVRTDLRPLPHKDFSVVSVTLYDVL